MLQTDHWAIPGFVTFKSKLLVNITSWTPLDFEKLNYEPNLLKRIQLGSLKIPHPLGEPRQVSLRSQLDAVAEEQRSLGYLDTIPSGPPIDPVISTSLLSICVVVLTIAGGYVLCKLIIKRNTRGRSQHEEAGEPQADSADESCGSLLTPPRRGYVPVVCLPSNSASGITKVPLVVPRLDPHQNSLDGKNLDLLPKESKS